MTQTKLAELSGIKQTLISSYCTGRHIPSLETRTKLGNAIGIPEDQVIRYLRSLTFDKGKKRSITNAFDNRETDIFPVNYKSQVVAEAFVRAIKLYARHTAQSNWKGVGVLNEDDLQEQTNVTLICVDDDPDQYVYTPDQIAVNSILTHSADGDPKSHIADVVIRLNNKELASRITDELNKSKIFGTYPDRII